MCTNIIVRITYDEPKRLATRAERGMDFASLTVGFFENAAIFPAKKGRLMAIGELNGQLITVVFVFLGTEAISVISMRATSRKERTWL